MRLEKELRDVIRKELEEIRILSLRDYALMHNDIYTSLYHRGVIDDRLIEQSLEKAAFKEANVDFQKMTYPRRAYTIYPDHCGRPDCLAYSLAHDKFTHEQIQQIPFDHGNAREFIEEFYDKNLPEKLKGELLKPECEKKELLLIT